jgi:hypothetical protein
VLADHEGARSGYLTFAVEVLHKDRGAGGAVGFVDAVCFDPRKGILGATADSWGLSSRGRVGVGKGDWREYCSSWKPGDVITADANLDDGIVTFYRGAECLGVAVSDLPSDRRIVPAICIGSTRGEVFSALQAVPPAVLRWDADRSKSGLGFSSARSIFTNPNKWATAVADHPGRSSGILSFGLEVQECHAGIAWGFVDPRKFHAETDNLGTAKHSWAVSRTGKRASSSGSGRPSWEEFCPKLSIAAGDLLGATADLDSGTIIFYYNGTPLGEAYADVAGSHHTLVPAVCTGSTRGDSRVTVKLVPYHVASGRSSGKAGLH